MLMETERRARIIAAVGTAIIAVLILLSLSYTYLSMSAQTPQPPTGEIMLMEEEFVEVMEMPTTTTAKGVEDSSSYLEEPQQNESQPAPASGTDLEDNGPVGEAPQVVTSKEPSPVKVKPDKPKNPGPSAEEIKKKEEEAIKRQATNEVANAFKNASGKNNAATSNTADKGPSGNNNVDRNAQGTTGTGTGSVGGGWIIPKYAAVRSTVTGSIKMIVKIDNTGRVQSVTFNGGEPPAATNSSVQAAVEREIRAHKFSRSNYDDAEGATAYITYTFK